MENKTNSPSSANAGATSYDKDFNNNNPTGANRADGKEGIMDTINSTLSNIQVPDAIKNIQVPQAVKDLQVPQAVKDFGTSCSRSYNSLSTTQKVIGGAAIALGATYLAASSNNWMGMGKSKSTATNGYSDKSGKKSKNKYS